VRIFRHMWNGMLRASEHGKRIHPTQKPIALCSWAFEKYGSAGDLIFDPFLGSGPSLKAAEQSGRTVIGCELSPHYIDHILEWGEARGLECVLID
jgi:DNA modification methylase